MVKPDDEERHIREVKVRKEGEINFTWEILYENGTIQKFYSIEESPRYQGTDEFVRESDQILADFLDQIITLVPNEGYKGVEYTVTFKDQDPIVTITKQEDQIQ